VTGMFGGTATSAILARMHVSVTDLLLLSEVGGIIVRSSVCVWGGGVVQVGMPGGNSHQRHPGPHACECGGCFVLVRVSKG
jgi:hypothetical protein